jgi:hypothetical protein
MVRTHMAVCRVSIPSGITLTPNVLLGAMRKLATKDIEMALDGLIQELDYRSGDPDCEPEPNEDSDDDNN